MNNEDNPSPDRDLRKHIASVIRAIDQAPRQTQITDEERQKLKTAASRLDQLLNDAAAADQQALKNAASRLDQLLADIRTGKELTLKRRDGQTRKSENPDS